MMWKITGLLITAFNWKLRKGTKYPEGSQESIKQCILPRQYSFLWIKVKTYRVYFAHHANALAIATNQWKRNLSDTEDMSGKSHKCLVVKLRHKQTFFPSAFHIYKICERVKELMVNQTLCPVTLITKSITLQNLSQTLNSVWHRPVWATMQQASLSGSQWTPLWLSVWQNTKLSVQWTYGPTLKTESATLLPHRISSKEL